MAELAARVVNAQLRLWKYRAATTDRTVICEVLLAPRPAYSGPASGDPRWPDLNFSPKGHVILDGGAQIGCFATWALREGAARLLCYEPEPSNAALLRQNLAAWEEEHGQAGVAEVAEAALAAGHTGGTADLLLGKARSDGTANTWRHALARSGDYKQGERARDGADDAGVERLAVSTVPLFGPDGALTDEITYVKLDIEGSELELLGGEEEEASPRWRQVRRLVFEYSFTKERGMGRFREVVRRLEAEGFTVMYEGKGSWERMESWPWHMDALVFAAR